MTKFALQKKAIISLFETSSFEYLSDFLDYAQSKYEWADDDFCEKVIEEQYKTMET